MDGEILSVLKASELADAAPASSQPQRHGGIPTAPSEAEVVDQVLAQIKALRRQRPEEDTYTDLVRLDKVVVNQALVYILHRLHNDSTLGT